jgi:hypothetical protein
MTCASRDRSSRASNDSTPSFGGMVETCSQRLVLSVVSPVPHRNHQQEPEYQDRYQPLWGNIQHSGTTHG